MGQIEVSWYAPGSSNPIPSEQPAPAEVGGVATVTGSVPVDKSAQDEEAVASGWGDDGEDSMGMF